MLCYNLVSILLCLVIIFLMHLILRFISWMRSVDQKA